MFNSDAVMYAIEKFIKRLVDESVDAYVNEGIPIDPPSSSSGNDESDDYMVTHEQIRKMKPVFARLDESNSDGESTNSSEGLASRIERKPKSAKGIPVLKPINPSFLSNILFID